MYMQVGTQFIVGRGDDFCIPNEVEGYESYGETNALSGWFSLVTIRCLYVGEREVRPPWRGGSGKHVVGLKEQSIGQRKPLREEQSEGQ